METTKMMKEFGDVSGSSELIPLTLPSENLKEMKGGQKKHG